MIQICGQSIKTQYCQKSRLKGQVSVDRRKYREKEVPREGSTERRKCREKEVSRESIERKYREKDVSTEEMMVR